MFAALSFLLSPSLGGAVSPVMLTEQTVLLGTGGRRAATHYAVGVVLTLAVIVVLLVFLGHAIELPTAPIPSASLDIALGVGLIAIGAATLYGGEHRPPGGKRKRPSGGGRTPTPGSDPAGERELLATSASGLGSGVPAE